MLDAETKRRIDSCRDILVGKVPDPKSQVEQITIALIYKFMDDMDSEAAERGGQRSFFAGKFAHYGWARLKAPELSGKEKLELYAEAIGKMNENPGIPAKVKIIRVKEFGLSELQMSRKAELLMAIQSSTPSTLRSSLKNTCFVKAIY